MAFVIPAADGNSPPLYNVEQAVGATGANANGDVKLVQYMLRHLYGAAASGLAVDGWMGPVTAQWIRRFQTDCKAGGGDVLVDGRVDRALGTVSSVSKTHYTILLLNASLRRHKPAALAALPQVVPMSNPPRPSPYNPKPVARYRVTVSSVGAKYFGFLHPDGTISVVVVVGDVIFT